MARKSRRPSKGPQRANTSGKGKDPVERFAHAVLAGKIVAGPSVRLACQRHLDDLEHGAVRGLHWDRAAAMRAIEFFPDVLVLAEGEFAGKPFLLQPWQQFCIGSLFGWMGADGYRRFRRGYLEIGKGNGKSPIAAGIGLYMLTADKEPSAEIYSAATMKDQAKILFRDAELMRLASKELKDRTIATVNNIAHMASNSYFRAISSEGKGLDGKRVHCALIDEVHEHPNDVVVEKMRAGTKGRRQALILEITNSGVSRQSVCWQDHEYSVRIMKRELQDDSWFAFVCDLDEGDDPLKSEACWRKANPNLGVSISLKYLREQVREAIGKPSKESLVRRLNFCQWVDAANPWITGDLWRPCEREDLDIADYEGRECYGGLDLGGSRDLTGLTLAFPDERDREMIDAFGWYWTPGDTMLDRARTDKVPYDVWEKNGFLIATPGRVVDYSFVAQHLGEIKARFDLRSVAFDPYKIKYLEIELQKEGIEITLVPHGQGYYRSKDSDLWMPHSVDLLEKKVGAGLIRVKKNPVLTWASASAVLEEDAKKNRIFTKRKSTGRIDPIVSMAMAVGNADAVAEAAAEPSIIIL